MMDTGLDTGLTHYPLGKLLADANLPVSWEYFLHRPVFRQGLNEINSPDVVVLTDELASYEM